MASESGTIDAVLKLLWRDPTRFQESVILEQFVGVYGVCQLLPYPNGPTHKQLSVVYPRIDLLPGPRGNVFGKPGANADIPNAQRDDARVLNLLFMQPGRPLSDAKDSTELKAAFVGAIMGQWALVNSHVQHRDVSVYNILLPLPDDQCKHSEWEREPQSGRNFAHESEAPDWGTILNDPLAPKYRTVESLKWKFDPNRRRLWLKRVVENLGPKPFGFLSDVDLANIVSLARVSASDMHTHRTGTRSFMAIRLLLADDGEQIEHTYLHDLESFFWVLLYVVATHCEAGAAPNGKAQQILDRLDIISLQALGDAKQTILIEIARGFRKIEDFGTAWATALAPTLRRFAQWIDQISTPEFDSTNDPDKCFEQVLEIFLPSKPRKTEKRGSATEHELDQSGELANCGSQGLCICKAPCHHLNSV